MQPHIKIVVAILVVALIAVIGLIVLTKGTDDGAGEPAAQVTTAPAEYAAEADKPENEDTAAMPTASPESEAEKESAQQAQDNEEDAQGTMYEGALAGLSEDEIGELAIAEEGSTARQDNTGSEGAVD